MITQQSPPREIDEFHSQFDELKRKALGKLSDNLFAIERKNIQQSRLFMLDLIPHIYRLYYDWPSDKILRVLDVGIECGAGTGLLAQLHNPRSYNYLKMNVTGLDIVDDFAEYIKLCFPFVKFMQKSIFDLSSDQSWDLVICSHVIEHLEQPVPFVRKLQELTNKYAIVACPYNETDLRPGHIQTVNSSLMSQLLPIEHHIYTNFCWRVKGECVVMVFESSAK